MKNARTPQGGGFFWTHTVQQHFRLVWRLLNPLADDDAALVTLLWLGPVQPKGIIFNTITI